MSTTINMPKKTKEEAEPMRVDQTRPKLARFWLQVDRQTKSSFSSMEEAAKAGQLIKDAHPILHVSIYDAQELQQRILTGASA